MILVDTSVWVDHLRRSNTRLVSLLEAGEVVCHPFVVGELACGDLRSRQEVLSLLARLPRADIAEHDEVLAFVEVNGLMGAGIGWIDAHLLSSVVLHGARLWSLDRRLRAIAETLGVRAEP